MNTSSFDSGEATVAGWPDGRRRRRSSILGHAGRLAGPSWRRAEAGAVRRPKPSS